MSISSLLMAIVLAAIPLTLILAAVPAGLQTRRFTFSDDQRWRFAWRAAQIISLLTLSAIALALLLPDAGLHWLSDQPLRLTLLLLLSVMALVAVKFSRRYLAADPGFGRYLRWLLLTLAAVALVFISNHLLLFALGWIAISLALHQLLMFYPERPRAALAAHKKFLLARLAETSLLVAFYLLWQQHGTANIDTIISAYQASAALSLNEQIAAVLIALTALIKCAQLPVHGWLIQVVEAPTPVSALLHAGVINLGGFLLILFAPLFLQVAAAQWLVLVVAGLTTVLAALIMTTRISIKVRLAWSTSAQMGLMLIECALGMVELALLHLLAHSAYKAWAFLSSGSAVQQHVQQSLLIAPPAAARRWLPALIAAAGLVAAAWWFSVQLSAQLHTGIQPVSGWLLLALALTTLLVQRASGAWTLLLAAGLALAYSLLKILLQPLSGELSAALRPGLFSAADLWVSALFLLLFSVWWLLRYRAHWPLVQRLSLALFAGLYLDEWFTRITLRLWPARLPVRANPKQLAPHQGAKHVLASGRKEQLL
ncbi:NADH-quinone oxidoreductase subunit L [Thalassolituus alkanivorans]|uniref:NADH-quinone oxidoreductase subunit L n=1 Tax=Thalassolituus alkanivorans TaxID=2881055 RepID=UPI001E34C8BF|nr:NADH-quinone oxidoreductase subunit L [Thalassolituus alkanivorans]MCB2387104.1 NADH-quinone oxidoreductase subunit L [Thalassolituus alkanivorans]MCB2421450.1 NADH-quinone oxidoreductase subunit L [Thalassolituus alkanivorans]